MSIHNRSGERLEQLLGVYRTDPDVDMDKCAANEIERLRETLDKYKKILEKNIDAILEKNRCIEELEYAYKVATSTEHLPPGCGKHIITTAQIRAAWAFRFLNDDIKDAVEAALRAFNIVRCEECRGAGDVGLNDCAVGCPDCGGEGWVKE